MVSEFEEREAAVANGYTWKEWQEFSLLDPEGRWNRAAGIAWYRLRDLVAAHKEDAVNSAMEQKSRGNH